MREDDTSCHACYAHRDCPSSVGELHKREPDSCQHIEKEHESVKQM